MKTLFLTMLSIASSAVALAQQWTVVYINQGYYGEYGWDMLNISAVGNNTLLAVASGSQPRILRSTDGGLRWQLALVEGSNIQYQPPSLLPTGTVFYVDIPDSNAIYLSYDKSDLKVRRYYADFYLNPLSQDTFNIETPPYYIIWIDPGSPPDTIIYLSPLQLRMLDANIGCGRNVDLFLVGKRVYYTSDGWKTDRRMFMLPVPRAYMPAPPVVLKPGTVGCIYYTSNSDSLFFARLDVDTGKWDNIPMPFTWKQYVPLDMCFIDNLTGWIVCSQNRGDTLYSNHIIFSTIDGGKNWSIQLDTFTSTPPLRIVRFKDKYRGIAAGGFGNVYITTNGGQSWTHVPIPVRGIIRSVCITDDAAYVGMGFGARIYRLALQSSNINDQTDQVMFSIYPNPAHDGIMITCSSDLTPSIYRLDGSFIMPAKPGWNDLHHLPPGVYILRHTSYAKMFVKL